MLSRESRELFWAVPLLVAPLATWGLTFLLDVLGLLDNESWVAVGLGFPVALTVAAGLLTRRSWLETTAGAAASVVVVLALLVVLFILFVPDDIFN